MKSNKLHSWRELVESCCPDATIKCFWVFFPPVLHQIHPSGELNLGRAGWRWLLSSQSVVAVLSPRGTGRDLLCPVAACRSSALSTADRTDTCCMMARPVHRRARRRCCCEFDWRRRDWPCIEHTPHTELNNMGDIHGTFLFIEASTGVNKTARRQCLHLQRNFTTATQSGATWNDNPIPGIVVEVPLPQRRVPAKGRVMTSQRVPWVVGHCVEIIHYTLCRRGQNDISENIVATVQSRCK